MEKVIQNKLGLAADGILGPVSWRAIELAICGTNSSDPIRSVQRKLGIVADGKAGNITLKSIVFFLFPPVAGGFEEKTILSKQTNGKHALKITPKAIVLHDTCGNYGGSVSWTTGGFQPNGKRLFACYHVIIARDGRRTITNADDNRAFHAGASSFNGRAGLNGWSLGLAFERDSNTEPLQEAAIASALEWMLPRMERWGIDLDFVTDHRTVSPGRKVDLAPKEFQKVLAELKTA